MALKIDDLPSAIRQAKKELRAALPNYRQVFAEVEEAISTEAKRIATQRIVEKTSSPRFSFPTSPNNASPRTRSRSSRRAVHA